MPEGDDDGDAAEGTEALRSEATACLARVASGDRSAKGRLFEMLYADLRAQAAAYLSHEDPGHTLQSTALVHEAWLRMIHQERAAMTDRGHFLALAAQAMRRIVIDHARTRSRNKRGGSWQRVDLDDGMVATLDPQGYDDVIAVDQALEQLGRKSERLAKIVELRFYGGLSREEVADALGISRSTVVREWRVARALMTRFLGDGAAPEGPSEAGDA